MNYEAKTWGASERPSVRAWDQALRSPTLLALTLLALLTLIPFSSFGGITEPATVFYGRIINRTSGQEYVLTNGHLAWVIIRSDGSRVSLATEVTVLRGGDFSYRLDVPHQALSSGLDVAS